ncbi:DUF4328 domain-containing protein [Rhodococcus sp. D2-41]|uniref:DUF4328 domain-containing protein n=1 Tax=Speluncibacter jeojiensis TaxID=2710754 RepID=UPI0024100A7B|nr:DUF4328 domain-containing protein [Rhodococcus sp. D2-41]MDG3010497.1 DUF4328 domain-containing protein [Rhodococcus sp. D2-41]
MTFVQACVGCGTLWPVSMTPSGPAPAKWCPRCQSALSAPFVEQPARPQQPRQAPQQLAPPPSARPAPPQRRRWNSPAERAYRWVARKPDHASARVLPPPPRVPGPTPRYRQTPTWGLIDNGGAPQQDARPSRRQSWADGTRPAMRAVVALYLVATAAELFRYFLLLRNRHTLISPITLAISDALAWVIGYAAPLAAIVAAVAVSMWLVDGRARLFAMVGRSDPRSARGLALGVLVPGWNLAMPGVFLTEMARAVPGDDPAAGGLTLRVRIWWAAWVLSAAVMVGNWLWRLNDSVQARADGVLFTAFGDLLAAFVAAGVLVLMDRFASVGAAAERRPHRWVAATS